MSPHQPAYLPDWETCRFRVQRDNASALESFIYHHEPAGDGKATVFRADLIAMLNDAYAAGAWVGEQAPHPWLVENPTVS